MGYPVITREVKCGPAGTVEVRELTLAEVRAHISQAEQRERAPTNESTRDEFIDLSMLGGFSRTDLKRFTNLTDDQIELLTPSAARSLLAEIKSLNPDFFEMLDQWKTALIERIEAGLTLSEQR